MKANLFDADRTEVRAAMITLVVAMASIVAGLWQAFVA
jgi:hypothetical protein